MKVEMSLVTLFKLLSSSLRFTLECTCMALVFPVVTIIAKKRQDGFYAWSERWTYPGFTGVVSFGLTRAPSFLLRYLWESLVNGDQCATCLIFTQFLSSPDIPCYWLSWGRRWMKKTACLLAFPIARIIMSIDDAAVVTFWFISMSLFFRKVHTVYIPAWWWRQQFFVILIFLTYKERCHRFTVLHWKRNLYLNVYPRAFWGFHEASHWPWKNLLSTRGVATCRLRNLRKLLQAAADLPQRKNVNFLQGNVAKKESFGCNNVQR